MEVEAVATSSLALEQQQQKTSIVVKQSPLIPTQTMSTPSPQQQSPSMNTAMSTTHPQAATTTVTAAAQSATVKKVSRGRAKRSQRQYFVVKSIVGQRFDNGELSFKLRLKNQGPESDSWVSADECRCEHLVSLWKAKYKSLAHSSERNFFFEFHL